MPKEFNLANEQAIIVSALKDQSHRKRIVATVSPEDFGGTKHQNIFEVVKESGNSEIDKHLILSVCDGEDVGGHEYLDKLYEMEVPVDIDSHLEIFYQYAARIRALDVAKASIEILDDPTYEYGEYEKASLEVVRAIREPYYRVSVGKEASKEHMELMEKRWSGESNVFTSTCFPVFDEHLVEGFAPGRIVVYCGRTRHGKSAFALESVYQQLINSDKKILAEPLEVGRTKFIDQLVSRWTGVSYFDIVRKSTETKLSTRKKIKKAINDIFANGRLTVIDLEVYRDIPKMTNDAVLDRFEQFVASGDYDIVVSDMFERKLFRRDIESISNALIREQQLVKRYNYCSILVHQLKRMKDDRKDKRPQLSDLYGSGYWEQCADIVLGVYRDKVYCPWLLDDDMEVSVLKQKSGRQDQVFIAECEPEINKIGEFRLMTADDEVREPMFPDKDK